MFYNSCASEVQLKKKMKCPCHSGKSYQECCEPFHKRKAPPTALDLMRSRFAAYALNLPQYIIESTHPQCPEHHSDVFAWAESIAKFSKSTQFHNLTIINTAEQGPTATVTFKAHLKQDGHDASFTEKSFFEKVNGQWLYKSGQISH